MSDSAVALPTWTAHARLGERTLLSGLTVPVYANFAGMSPPCDPVRAAIVAAVDELASRGAAAGWGLLGARETLRARLATLVGVAADEIGLVPNTTTGLRAIAFGLPWRAGDRVIGFDGEFPANVTPWQQAAAAFDGTVTLLPLSTWSEPQAGLAELDRSLAQGRVLAVAVSAVQFASGLRMPLAEIGRCCRAHGAAFVVDGIQACGAVPLDCEALGIDALACGGHKWLGGAMGLGFVAMRHAFARTLRPRVAGWTSHEDAAAFLLQGPGLLRYDRPVRARADFVEDGGSALALVPGLVAAVELLLALGVERIAAHAQRWHDALEPALLERGFRSRRAPQPEARSGILGVEPPPGVDVVALHRALEEHGVACAIPDGVLRFAPHWSNHIDEIPRVLAALDAHR
ncbi:MAG: aminotransferase class V-fold PLP-dependent enzyme [Nannocystaceae bacterium]|nr:aminotransferase class V-fold PLP-dependent enzyme [Nannocystaceae bacterium]